MAVGFSSLSTSSIRPAATTPPSRSSCGVAVATRNLLDVVGDQHRRRGVRVGGQRREPVEQVLTATEVQPGGRLVQQQQLRVGHRARAIMTRCARPRTGCRTGGRPARARRARPAAGPPGRCRCRRSAPASARAPRTRADHEVPHHLVAGNAQPEPGRGPTRVRSSNTLTRPSRSPNTWTTPTVGCSSADASRNGVVLPAPLGPSTTHRSSSSTAQSTSRNSIELPGGHRPCPSAGPGP